MCRLIGSNEVLTWKYPAIDTHFISIQSSVIPSTSKAFDYRPLFRDDTVNIDPSLIETPIHEPLREMGFDSILISEAIR